MEEVTHYYQVYWRECGNDRLFHQECFVRDEDEVKRIYGLEEPDIDWYEIKENEIDYGF